MTNSEQSLIERIERIEKWIDFWETIETGWNATALERESVDLEIAAIAMLKNNHPKMDFSKNTFKDTYIKQAQICADAWGFKGKHIEGA